MKKSITIFIIIALFIVSAMVFNANILNVHAESSVYVYGDFEYIILEDGTVGLTKYVGCDADVVIPQTIDGKIVTAINIDGPQYPDWECPSTDKKVKSITIPESVTEILFVYFSRYPNLKEIKVDKNNKFYTSVDGVLYNKTKTEIKACPRTRKEIIIPQSVTRVGRWAFFGCDALSDVELPEGVAYLGAAAFSGCSGLTAIKIPDGVTEIPFSVFLGCRRLTSITIPDGVSGAIGDEAFYGCEGLESIVIPKGVTSIGQCSFARCINLKTIALPDGIKSIGWDAFAGCSSLTDISLPKSLNSLYSEVTKAFSNCKSLQNIEVDKDNEVYCSVDGILYDKAKTELIICPEGKTEVVISDGVEKIKKSAFSGCSYLMSVTIPKDVINIEDNAFFGCDNLTIVGMLDSYAETYAKEQNIPFREIGAIIPVSQVKLDESISLEEGESTRLTVVITPREANDKSVTWATSNSAVAMVSEDGTIVAIGEGVATVTATANDGSAISASCEVIVTKKVAPVFISLKKIKLDAPKDGYVYDGKTHKPEVVVYDSEGNKVDGEHFDVKYSAGCKQVGAYTVTVTGKDNYDGELTATFLINPKKISITKLTAKSKAFTVKWKKQDVTGYEICYATKSNFSGKKTVKIKSAKTTSKTISKLKSKTKYYVKIRTYKTVKGKKYYSKWSSVKTIKTKK